MCGGSCFFRMPKADALLRASVIKSEFATLEYDEVLYIVRDFCQEHGRLAFMEGLKIGMSLMRETEKG